MKYLIDDRCIPDHAIVQVYYEKSHSPNESSRCEITLISTSVASELNHTATSDWLTLRGKQADAFWSLYTGDAQKVIP